MYLSQRRIDYVWLPDIANRGSGQVLITGAWDSPSMVESPGVGYKQSGVGEAGYLKYTRIKTVFIRTGST